MLDLAEVEQLAEYEERAHHLSSTALAAQGRGKDIKKQLQQFDRAQKRR